MQRNRNGIEMAIFIVFIWDANLIKIQEKKNVSMRGISTKERQITFTWIDLRTLLIPLPLNKSCSNWRNLDKNVEKIREQIWVLSILMQFDWNKLINRHVPKPNLSYSLHVCECECKYVISKSTQFSWVVDQHPENWCDPKWALN